MARFQINILGCGSATPTVRHNPSCQVIDFRDRLFMIDCGEGAQVQMRRMKLSFSRLGHIFISHLHGDHCFGLPGLLSTMALHEKGGEVTIHMPADGIKIFREITDYFCRDTPFVINYEAVPEGNRLIYEDHALTIESFPLYHRIPCVGYIFREKPKLRHLKSDMVEFYQIPIAMRQAIKEGADFVTSDGATIPNARLTTPADKSMSYAYCSDTMFDERVAKAVQGVDTLYHETTYDDAFADKARQRGHSTAREAARIAREAGVRQLIIGHYSKRYTDVSVLLDQAREEFTEVIPAAEGLKIDLL